MKNRVPEKQMTFPSWFFPNQIFINGQINKDLVDQIINTLDDLIVSYDEIVVHLNSPGGDFLPTKRLYDKLINLAGETRIIGIAGEEVSSGAVVLFEAFNLRLVGTNTKMLLHNLSQTTRFKFIPFVSDRDLSHDILDREFDDAENIQKWINQILSSVSGLEEQEIIRLLQKEQIFSAQEIIDLGLADGFYPNDLS